MNLVSPIPSVSYSGICSRDRDEETTLFSLAFSLFLIHATYRHAYANGRANESEKRNKKKRKGAGVKATKYRPDATKFSSREYIRRKYVLQSGVKSMNKNKYIIETPTETSDAESVRFERTNWTTERYIFVYLYVYISICIYIYIYTHTQTYTNIDIHMCVYIYISIYIRTYVHTKRLYLKR